MEADFCASVKSVLLTRKQKYVKMENSAIYVRERGNLRRVSDIVLAQPKPVSSCIRTNPFVLRKENFIFTYNAEGSLRYTTKSLFDITLLFVADNIHHVDSLVGFPDQIGDRLFAAAEENRVFLNADISSKALQLFSDAYGEMVLGSLCLRNRSVIVPTYIQPHSLMCLRQKQHVMSFSFLQISTLA